MCECQLLSISNIPKLALKRFYLHFWRFYNFISRHLRVKFSIANKTGNFLWTWPWKICSFNSSWISLCDHLSSCTLFNVTRWNKNLSWPYVAFVSNFYAIIMQAWLILPLRSKKAGWLVKLLDDGRSHSILPRGSVSLSCATKPHPAFLNLNGTLRLLSVLSRSSDFGSQKIRGRDISEIIDSFALHQALNKVWFRKKPFLSFTDIILIVYDIFFSDRQIIQGSSWTNLPSKRPIL